MNALVMFDYDGVIVNSLELFTANFIAACQEFDFREIKTTQDAVALFDGNIYSVMAARGLTAQTIDQVLMSYEARQNRHLDEVELFPGISEALSRIAGQNMVFIITSNLSRATTRVLRNKGINYFEDVIGAEQEKSKLKKIMSTMAIYPGLPAYYVGDTKGDMLEGKQAGAVTIGVTWGWHSAQKLMEGKPDFLVNTPEELAGILCNP